MLSLELVWWVVTAMLVYAVLYPIHKAMREWVFEVQNIIFMVGLITFTRYTFLLRHTFIARQQLIKVVLILLLFPLTFYLISQLNAFLALVEEQTWEPFTGHLPPNERQQIEEYIWNEMLFFGAGCVIAAPVFAVRLFISIWRQHNRNSV